MVNDSLTMREVGFSGTARMYAELEMLEILFVLGIALTFFDDLF